jgi:hypothetical protein
MNSEAQALYRLLSAYKDKGIEKVTLDVTWVMSVLERWPPSRPQINRPNVEVDGGQFSEDE